MRTDHEKRRRAKVAQFERQQNQQIQARYTAREEVSEEEFQTIRSDFLFVTSLTQKQKDAILRQTITLQAVLSAKNPVHVLRDLRKAKTRLLTKLANSVL
jgi:hypothetical protein